MNRNIYTYILCCSVFCIMPVGYGASAMITDSQQALSREFLEQFAPPFVYQQNHYDENIINLVIRAWSKLDLLQAFHTEKQDRVLFSHEIVDDILLLHGLLIVADKQQFDWLSGLRSGLVERIVMMKQTSELLFDSLPSDEVATIRFVLAKILNIVET